MFEHKNSWLVFRLVLTVFLVLGMFGIRPEKSVSASTLTVTTTNDSGTGSLRQAIANASSGDTIKFAASLAGQTITLTSQLDITKNLVIDGSSLQPRVSVSGNNTVRIFNISNNRIVTLRSLILKNGKMSGLSYTSFGGALFTGSGTTITIDRVLITDNSAYSAGAIYISSSAVATIINSEITGNEADTEGGAVRVNSTGILNLKNSAVSNNTAGSSGTVYFSGATNPSIIENNVFENNSAFGGGAILGQLGNARIEIRNNLFIGNHAAGTSQAGGALYFSASTIPTLIILENNTFYDNVATGSGGGAYLASAVDYYLINNTFSNNTAVTGGNLYLGAGVGVPKMYNNIIANSAGGGDCYAFFNSYINGSHNLVEDGSSGCSPNFTGDPGLLPLADNGGPTLTMALQSDSPALDAGNNTNCTTTDQRGVLRPQGTACDLGAVELDETAPTVISSEPINDAVFIADAPTSIKFMFSEPMDQYSDNGRVNDRFNYLLLNDNGDGFQTNSCVSGVSVQDQSFPVDNVLYDNATRTASLTVNGGSSLPAGSYQLFVCGTSPAITDVAGNSINNGLMDTVISFRVIAASDNSILENQPDGTDVLTLTAPAGSTFSYSLADTEPDCNGADNSSFSFVSNQLVATISFDYETKTYYMICVTIHEAGGNSYSQELDILVSNVNEQPTDIGLFDNEVNENLPIGSQVGFLSTQDPDANSTFTYSLVNDVSGCNADGNGYFTIAGNILKTNAVFDYETKADYSLCIRSVDNGGLSIAEQFTIVILDVNDAPSDIILTPASIVEGQPGNTLVGNLIAIDPDGPTTANFLSLPGKEGCSSTGFNWFVISNGNEIRALASLNYNMASSYTLCIRATDSLGAVFEKQLTITVVDITSPTVLSIARVNTSPTAMSSVDFTVIFSEDVTGVAASDFALTTSGVINASIASLNGSGDTYTVTVNTGIGNGTIRLDVPNTATIKDLSNYSISGLPYTDGETYDVYRTAPTVPTVSSITRMGENPTDVASVDFMVAFSEPVTGVDTSDFILTVTNVNGASITSVVDTGNETSYTVTVNTGDGNGTIRLDVVDDDSIVDDDDNPLGGAGTSNGDYINGEVYSLEANTILQASFNSVGTYDGWILESSETSNSGGTLNTSGSLFYLGDDAQDKQYRAILHFDTSSLPDNAVIVDAKLRLATSEVVSGTNPFLTHDKIVIELNTGAYSTSSNLQLDDFRIPSDRNGAGAVTNNLVNGLYRGRIKGESLEYFNLSGATQIRLRFKTDDDDDNVADQIEFYSGNASASADRPRLVIYYYIP